MYLVGYPWSFLFLINICGWDIIYDGKLLCILKTCALVSTVHMRHVMGSRYVFASKP